MYKVTNQQLYSIPFGIDATPAPKPPDRGEGMTTGNPPSMYSVITITSTEHFDTFNLAWAYAQQLGQPYEMSFDPSNRNRT